MSDVSVIQDASLNLKKVGPPRALLACVGACLGLVLGLLQAIVRDTPVQPASDRGVRRDRVRVASEQGFEGGEVTEQPL